ncbi:MAG: YmdB family metallophosphoesterase, partial [Spirochaetaceae bacterium]|nr:YmdB family metallophosphoesterase [Spirochaetaceae bacterium]
MNNLRILYLGDLVGKPGLRALYVGLSPLVKETGARIVAVNGENLAEGFGLTPDDKDKLFSMGVSVISSGNHIWQRDDLFPFLDSERNLLRPENYPPGVPGHGSIILEVSGNTLGFLNLQGRERMG